MRLKLERELLLPEELICEKVDTYLKRRKIRDLYDIFFLMRHVKEVEKINQKLKELFDKFKEPVDEKELSAIVLYGVAPKSEEMLDYIRRWQNEAHR